jgi:hypothetical protein
MKTVYPLGVYGLTARLVHCRTLTPLLVLINLSCLLASSRLDAEGTREVMPNPNNGTGLIVSTTTTFPLGDVGTYLGAPPDDRVYFHIANSATEVLYYGFNWETLSPATPITTYNDVYMNIYDPTGTLVTTVHLPSTAGSAGFISSYVSAIQGPKIGGLPPTGYTPLTFTPTMNGDYYVSFYRSEDGGNTHIAGGESMLSKYFDMTVAAGVVKYTGRVHCQEWALSVYNPLKNDVQDPQGSTNAVFYGYTTDSVTIEVSFPDSGYKPLSYIVAFNSFGCVNTGNWQSDRRSIVLTNLVAPYLSNGYPVFLNPPDPAIYPISSIPNPPRLVDPVISGCPPGPYKVRFNAPQAGDYFLLFDLNGIPGYQPNSSDLFIEIDGQTAGIVTYSWNGLDGLGNAVPANTSFPITFSYRKGRINIPMYDDELNIGGFSVTGISPAGAMGPTPPILYWDDTQLYNVGSDCSNNNNNFTGSGFDNSVLGVAQTDTTGRAWNGNGNPTNVIPAPYVLYSGVRNDTDQIQCDDFGNARLLNTWAWGIVLNTTDTLTLACISVSGTVWDDADGSANGTFTNIRTNSEVGTNAGGQIYANLVDPITGDVLSAALVSTGGTFTLPDVPVNSTGLEIYLTTTEGTLGLPVPAAGIPASWVNTSPLVHTFNSGSAPVTGIDFGIEQLPTSVNQNYTIATPVLNSLLPLNGTGSLTSPGPLEGSDPEDGALGAGKNVVIVNVATNEQLYYNGVLLSNNYLITNYNPALLEVKFIDLSQVSTSFTYDFEDAAGKEGLTPATYTINMSVILSSTLSSFTGKATDLGNLLTWTSYNETATTRFIIERSVDGVTFTDIGQVTGAGDNATVNHSYTDNSPVPNTPNYYRLKWTDATGNIAYSNTVTIARSLISGLMDVSPNPFLDRITVRVDLSKAQAVAIRLLDSKGALLQVRQYEGAMGINAFDLEGLSGLPPSVYLVQIILTDQVFVRKIFNNR